MRDMTEQGSVLLVSLILLLILTVAGMASIRVTSLEERMAGNYRNEQIAFHSAEVGVQEAESFVANTGFNPASFTSDCSNGLCFDGSYPEDPGTCKANSASPWLTQTTWEETGRHRDTSNVLDGVARKAKFIVEFRCYLPRDDSGPAPDPAALHDWSGFYRITVFATGGDDSARVMLQTTYKKNF